MALAGIILNGIGTVNLLNINNTFSGAVTINAGILNTANLLNGGLSSSIGSSSDAASNLVLNGGTLQYNGATAQTTSRLFTVGTSGATLDFSGTAAIAVVRFNNVGAIATAGSGARILTLTGTNSGDAFTVGAGESYTSNRVDAVISDQAAVTGMTKIVKNGTGVWTLGGGNTYSGGTDINGGYLQAKSAAAIGTGPVNVAAGAELSLNFSGGTIANNITLNGTSSANGLAGALIGNNLAGAGNNTITGILTLNATSNINTTAEDKSVTLQGKVTGAGGLLVERHKVGLNPFVILANPTNDFQGGITVTHGALRTTAVGVIPSGAGKGNVTVATGAFISLVGNSQSINGLNGGGNLGAGSGTPTITLGNNNAVGTFSGTLTDTGRINNGTTLGLLALTKVGTGTQTLSGANSYTGNTNVSAGTLELAATGVLKFIPTLNGVSNSLGGTGTVLLKGSFNIDLTAASTTSGNTWNLVDVANLNETFDASFTVTGFTETSNVWTRTIAANTFTFTESTGVFSVAPAAGYTSYIGGFVLADSSVLGDPDNDGTRNILEYVLNGNPGVSDPGILPSMNDTGANFVFSFTRREESASDTTQTFQYSSTLGSWTDIKITPPTGPEVTLGTPAGGLQSVTVTIPKTVATGGKLFGRLEVSKP